MNYRKKHKHNTITFLKKKKTNENIFMILIQKAWLTKGKIDKWDLLTLKNFCAIQKTTKGNL